MCGAAVTGADSSRPSAVRTMSGSEFRSLLYTDCRAGTGLGEADGLQFQAVSPGCSVAEQDAVRAGALYQPPAQWMRDNRPAADYPPSLVHLSGDLLITARGVYRGDGVREGDHFTHALTSTDPDSYGAVRPAQLWRARWWRERPVEGTECPPVSAEPEPGPLRAAALRDWVLGQHGGQAWLMSVHSAIDRLAAPGAQPVVFVGADADTVIRWIAAGTLLLPQQRALQVGFRVFAADPQHELSREGGPSIVAAHPDWAGDFAEPANVAGAVVFNVATGQCSQVDPTASALHWVPRFLSTDSGSAGPGDVLEAVELAHRLGEHRGATSTGDRLAAGILVLDERVGDTASGLALAEWLGSPPPVYADDFVRPVLDVLLRGQPEPEVLAGLADPDAERAGMLRIALLRADVEAVVRGEAEPVGQRLPEREHSEQEAADAIQLVDAALRSVPPAKLGELLLAAQRHHAAPGAAQLVESLREFVRWWLDHPHAAVDPSGWPCAEQLAGLLRAELAERTPQRQAQAVRDGWWRPLVLALADPGEQIDVLVARAAVAEGGGTRAAALEAFREQLRAAGDRADPEAVWNALFAESPPTVHESAMLFGAMPSTAVPEALAGRALSVLGGAPVTAEVLEMLRTLAHHLGDENPELRALWEQDARLRTWLTAVQRAEQPDALEEVPEAVLAARSDDVIGALLAAPLQRAWDATVQAGSALQHVLMRELPEWFAASVESDQQLRAVALTFLVGWSDSSELEVRKGVDRALERWAAQHEQADYRRVSRLLRGVEAAVAAAWHAWIKELSGQRAGRRPHRAAADWAMRKWANRRRGSRE